MASNPASARGFTLIELLVAIAIIGILASIVLVSLSAARAKARDTQRVAHAKELRTMLKLYANDHGGYPGTANQWYVQSGCSGITGYPFINSLLVGYGQLPEDINGEGCIYYMYDPSTYGSINSYQYAILVAPELPSTVSLGQGCFANYYCVGQP